MGRSPLKWHQANLENSIKYAASLEYEINRLQTRLDLLRKDNEFLEYQIKEAMRLGMDGFDEDKFRRKVHPRLGEVK